MCDTDRDLGAQIDGEYGKKKTGILRNQRAQEGFKRDAKTPCVNVP